MNNSTVSYLSSERLRTGEAQTEGKLFVNLRARILQGTSSLLSVEESIEKVPETQIDLSKGRYQMDRPNIYKDWATWDTGEDMLLSIRQIVSVRSRVLRPEYGIKEEIT